MGSKARVDAARWSVLIVAVFVLMSSVVILCVGSVSRICGRSVDGIERMLSC